MILILTSVFIAIGFIAILNYRSIKKAAKLNHQLAARVSDLQNINSAKDHLFSVLAHDLRSPVNMLSALSEIQEFGIISDEKTIRYEEELKDTLAHASLTIESLLQWVKSQMQGYKPHISQVNVSEILNTVVSELTIEATIKNISIIVKTEFKFKILCDANMMKLILANLIKNAIKFTHEDGNVSIEIAEKNGLAYISVEDDGVGMSDEQMTLFNERATLPLISTKGTHNEKGTGVGLLLSKTFTLLMNGRISVSKKPGFDNGCTITIVLPKIDWASN